MICQKCGAEVREGEAFCSVCGEPVQPAAPVAEPAAPVVEAPAAAAPVAAAAASPVDKVLNTLKEKNINPLFLAIGGAALIVVILLLCLIFGSGSPEKVAGQYVKASAELNLKKSFKYSAPFSVGGLSYNKMMDLVADELEARMADAEVDMDEVREALEDEYGTSNIRKVLDKSVAEQKEEQKEYLEEAYGSGYKVKVKAVKVRDISKDKFEEEVLEDYNERIENMMENVKSEKLEKALSKMIIDSKKVKKVCRVKVTATIKGRVDEEESDITYNVVKVGGKWRVMDEDSVSVISSMLYSLSGLY